jgi:formamidopyrimidine-DNA glycosylase
MPEIPDLEAIRGFLNERIVGVEVTKAEALIPHVVRSGAADFEAALTATASARCCVAASPAVRPRR